MLTKSGNGRETGVLYQPDGSTCTNWRIFYSNLVPLVFGQCFDLLHDLEDGLLLEPPRHHLNGQRHSHGALRGFFHPFHKLQSGVYLSHANDFIMLTPTKSFEGRSSSFWSSCTLTLSTGKKEVLMCEMRLVSWQRSITLTRYNACRHIEQVPCDVGLD